MPAFDQCHEQVVSALQKDGWRIEDQQIKMSLGKRRVFVDLRAVREVNGDRQQIMLVEIKCFPEGENITQELYMAIGQYVVYRAMLTQLGLDLPLYLSIPETIFDSVFDVIIQTGMRDSRIKLVIVNLEQERIVRWIE
jgi:hypothetical protein